MSAISINRNDVAGLQSGNCFEYLGHKVNVQDFNPVPFCDVMGKFISTLDLASALSNSITRFACLLTPFYRSFDKRFIVSAITEIAHTSTKIMNFTSLNKNYSHKNSHQLVLSIGAFA